MLLSQNKTDCFSKINASIKQLIHRDLPFMDSMDNMSLTIKM